MTISVFLVVLSKKSQKTHQKFFCTVISRKNVLLIEYVKSQRYVEHSSIKNHHDCCRRTFKQEHPTRIQFKNHLNMALLNVNRNLNGRYRHIFIPKKYFICSDFLAESLVIRKLQRSKLTFSKISAKKKRLPKILGDLFRVTIR